MGSEQVGRHYSQRSGWQRLQGMRLLELAAPAVGERVLDVGCGTGELTELIADAVGPPGHVTGVDLDLHRLQIARQRPGRPNVAYRQQSGEEACDGAREAWDLVFSNYVIHWMPDRPKFLAGARRSLRPGGRLAFSTIEGLPQLFTTFSELAGDKGKALLGRLYFVRLEQLAGEVTAAGLEIVHAARTPQTKEFGSLDEALHYWEATTHGAVRPGDLPPAAPARLRSEAHGRPAAIDEQVVTLVAVKREGEAGSEDCRM